MLSTPRAETSSILVGLLFSLFSSGFGERLFDDWHCIGSSWVKVMGEDTIVSLVAIAFGVKDAWSIMMEFACCAFFALTFQVILA
jgi:hypothetical protein